MTPALWSAGLQLLCCRVSNSVSSADSFRSYERTIYPSASRVAHQGKMCRKRRMISPKVQTYLSPPASHLPHFSHNRLGIADMEIGPAITERASFSPVQGPHCCLPTYISDTVALDSISSSVKLVKLKCLGVAKIDFNGSMTIKA